MTGAIIPDDWDGVTYKCFRIRWPSSDLWEAILLGQVTEPSTENYWDEDTGDAEEAAVAVSTAYSQTIPDIYEVNCGEQAMIGAIMFWGQQDDPDGWHKCDGFLLDTTTFAELFAIIGYTFGGSGSSFALPDCGGRFPLHTPNIGGINQVGFLGGEVNHELTTAELPAHNHPAEANPFYQGASGTPNGGIVGGGTGADFYGYSTLAVRNTGSNVPHNNMPLYLSLNLIIKVFEVS